MKSDGEKNFDTGGIRANKNR